MSNTPLPKVDAAFDAPADRVMHRLHAIDHARDFALEAGKRGDHAYLPATDADAANWLPHAWVVDAICAASLPQAQPTPAPDGWVMVPREPTEEMVKAYLLGNAKYWEDSDKQPTPPDRWRGGTPAQATAAGFRAMIAAAPPPVALTPLTDEREAFEAWIRKDSGDLTTFGQGSSMHYTNSAVNNAWSGWTARAAHGIKQGGQT